MGILECKVRDYGGGWAQPVRAEFTEVERKTVLADATEHSWNCGSDLGVMTGGI